MNDSYDILGGDALGYLRELAVKAYAQAAYDQIVEQASQQLHSTRNDYLEALQIRQEGRFIYSIVLSGIFANKLEDGSPPFDMKEGFSRSPKRKIKAGGGWYLTIPMLFRTTSAKADSGYKGQLLPRGVYDLIRTSPSRKKQRSETVVVSVLDAKDVPVRYDPVPKAVTLPSGLAATYIPKSSIYAGLQRVQNTENGKSTYNTFRRVSDKSDPNSWIHPGFPALRLMEAGIELVDFDTLLDNVLDTFFEDLS